MPSLADLLATEKDYKRRLLSDDSDVSRFSASGKLAPPSSLAELLANANASLNSFSVPMSGLQPRYIENKLNVGGYTVTDGPLKGQVIVANPSNLPRENVLGHESFHARALETPLPLKGEYEPFGYGARSILAENMAKIQPKGPVAGPYWGLQPNSSTEEQIANLVGYEASLPKGKSIVDSPIADQLFAQKYGSLGELFSNAQLQKLKDYYFTQSSIPSGGVWEGQVGDTGTIAGIKEKLRRALMGRVNTVNR